MKGVPTTPLPMRELHRLARESLGPKAATLKTRKELEHALALGTPRQDAAVAAPVTPAQKLEVDPGPLVTRDFFLDPPSR